MHNVTDEQHALADMEQIWNMVNVYNPPA
jgi:hypothetical protein